MKSAEIFEIHQSLTGKYFASKLPTKSISLVASTIKDECSEVLEAYQNTHRVLYRGIKEMTDVHGNSIEGNNVIKAYIRKNRKPMFMDPNAHSLINNSMLALGLHAHRGNSLFCSANRYIASEWGACYAIFPVNGWTGTIFTKVKHDYVFLKLTDTVYPLMQKDIDKKEKEKIVITRLKQLGARNFSTAKDLAIILNEQYEDILITGTKYYGLKISSTGVPVDEANDILALLGI